MTNENIAFPAFAKLRVYFPKTKCFMQVVSQWYWVDDENNIVLNNDGYICLKEYEEQ